MPNMTRGYIPGDRWVECSTCGFAYRFSQMQKGVMGFQKGHAVCPTCFDPVHPNENWKLPTRVEGKLDRSIGSEIIDTATS